MLFDSCFYRMTMEEVTTSISESYHRATKRVAGGPRPFHDLGEAAERINNRSQKTNQAKEKRAA